jgi:HAMP domain-containing protein
VIWAAATGATSVALAAALLAAVALEASGNHCTPLSSI